MNNIINFFSNLIENFFVNSTTICNSTICSSNYCEFEPVNNEIIINGKKYNGNYVKIDNDGKIYVDNIEQDFNKKAFTKFEIKGDVKNLKCTSVTIDGNITGDVKTTTIKVSGNVSGDIDATTVTIDGSHDGNIKATVVRK